MKKAKITFVIGGANSGKTGFSLKLLNEHSKKVYLATGQAFDDEMKLKIKKHKEERLGMDITTIEEPFNLKNVWKEIDKDSVVLLDCLTMWGTNVFYSGKNIKEEAQIHFDKDDMNFKELIIVTNEIGMGGINLNKEGREANALLGFLNQFMGDLCDEAWAVLCGIPRRWKP